MLFLLYLLISFFWLAGVIAFMNAHKDDPKYWIKGYSWQVGLYWKDNMIAFAIVGFIAWPFVIPSVLAYKLIFKFFNNKKQ